MTNDFNSGADFFVDAAHRNIVSSAICQAKTNLRESSAAPESKLASVCVVGAGRCNDLELKQLIDCFDQISLVDSNLPGIKKGLSIQGFETHSHLKLLEIVDPSGIDGSLNQIAKNSNRDQFDVAELIELVSTVSWPGLSKEFDVMVSNCVVSRSVINVIKRIGENHDQLVPLIKAIRKHHLELMLRHLRSGGVGLLIFDFVSSDQIPSLPDLSGEPLERALSAAIDGENFVYGLNPQKFLSLIEYELKDQMDFYGISRPWVRKDPSRAHAVSAILFRKK